MNDDSKNQSDAERDDALLAGLLHGLPNDAPPPNAELLAALREKALAAFVDASAVKPAASEPETTDAPTKPSLEPRRSVMFTLLVKSGGALAALAAAIAVWFSVGTSPEAAGVPFSEVLARLRGAKSLELRITRDGRTSDVYVRAPGFVRWNDSPGRYRIAAGSRLWQIDESTNTATTGASPWFTADDKPVDLLKLLDADVVDAAALASAKPVGRVQYAGGECFVYRAPLATKQGQIEIEAFVEPRTNQLRGIVARGQGADRNAGAPLAELQLVAVDAPLDDDKFTPAKSLTEDGRIGKISDAQGIVGLRPMLAGRWTPVYRETLLKPGDWVRTDIRGANAARVRFSTDMELTLGPGTLLECISPKQAKLHGGEVQVHVPRPANLVEVGTFELLGPRAGGEKFTTPGKTFLRVDRGEQLVKLDKPETWPKWLAGFEGTAAQESLGSLIVNLPDGRNEPLTVGYHKVSVEIRDQIARTTIEESFVNHTDGRLEGIFHFPLPQDASISGFGMWIGDELVEADVVEKQRAREIYETILRERRDPGLLEWTGGNLFKARVFPIEARSEKRVKIVYTQVLPLRANQYRYAYGLRSDLLRTKPLRELSLTVTIASALPLKKVSCPTHAARTQQTEHAAQVEFTAQEYSPERDFEVVCEIDARQSDVVVVPHRRGDDGYLLVQLMPPGIEGNWQREILPDGAPLNLVLVCDTSGSMDSEKRRQQAEFVAAVLSSLGEKDRFLLAATDTSTKWLSLEPLAPSAERLSQARDFLDRRISLGWTDLDQAFDTVLRKAPADAQIIYIGDGIQTAGDRNPASVVKRLAKRIDDHRAAQKDAAGPTFHAVTVGNTHEMTILQGIATVGGGSTRAIAGERTPQAVALELLNELAQPGWRDLAIEFRGVRTAAVYPDRLPNVAAGTQQILVGRYLPEGKEQSGEIVVSGRRGDEAVRYVAKVRFPDNDEGNSFIPRLWARSHLDHLLAQGDSPAIHDEVIGLSEEYHIMTPYTSLLVLETDADRERFGVQRRYEMRDGERFFQQGRDDASFELAQQQMKRAGDWRLGLRSNVLRQLATLGRDSRMFQPQSMGGRYIDDSRRLPETYWAYNERGAGLGVSEDSSAGVAGSIVRGGSGGVYAGDSFNLELLSANSYSGGTVLNGGRLGLGDASPDFNALTDLMTRTIVPETWSGEYEFDSDDEFGLPERKKEMKALDFDSSSILGGDLDDILMFTTASFDEEFVGGKLQAGLSLAAEEPAFRRDFGAFSRNQPATPMVRFEMAAKRKSLSDRQYGSEPYTNWLAEIFPNLAGRPAKTTEPVKAPAGWSPEAVAVAKSLLRDESLRKLNGGIAIDRISESFDPIWNRRSSRSSDLALYSATAWLTKPQSAGGHTIVNYCNQTERGVFSIAFLLGQTRPSVERDYAVLPLSLSDSSLAPMYGSYPLTKARVEPAGENRVRLVIEYQNSTFVRKFLIDTAKHVLLEMEGTSDGKMTSTIRYSDFIEAGGSWWATKIVTSDSEGRKTGETVLDVKALAPNQYAARMQAELAPLAKVQLLRHPMPTLADARRRTADGSATFDDRLTMIVHYAGMQQWDELLAQLDAAEKLAADKPGVAWLRPLILAAIRRNEPARQRLSEDAKQLVARPRTDELVVADFLIRHNQQVSAASEQLSLVELLRPVYERQPAETRATITLGDYLAQVYRTLGRGDEALAIAKTQAEQTPWETHRQTAYAQALLAAGRSDEAYVWLDQQLARPEKRSDYDADVLRSAYAGLLHSQARYDDLLAYTTKWIALRPVNQTGYEQHLSALISNNRLDEAYALADRWMQEARVEGKLAPDVQARLNSALRFAEGYIAHHSFQRIDERWQEPLSATARHFLRRDDGLSVLQQVMGYRFRETEAADRLRAEFLQLLQKEADTLPLDTLRLLVEQTLSGRFDFAEPIDGRRQMDAAEVPVAIWKEIAAQLHARWEKADNGTPRQAKHALSVTLQSIYATRFADTELLPFLRQRIETADADFKSQYEAELFEVLLARPWTDDLEQEAFRLLRQLSADEKPAERLAVQVPALHRLVDAMLAARQTAARKQFTDRGDVNKLTRTEFAERIAEFRKNAHIGLAKRLSEELPALVEQKSGLADWVRIELHWLDVQRDSDLDQVAAFCRRIVGDAPAKQPAFDEDAEREQIIEQSLAALLRQRALVTLMNLAARKNAEPEAAAKLLRYFDAGIALDDDNADAWRFTKYQFLVALDRPDDLERELRNWIREEATTAPWRQSLALLLAERGKLDEAIQLFEAAEKLRLLSASDYQLLSGWYLARNRREDHDRTLVAIFKHVPEYQLRNMIYGIRDRRDLNTRRGMSNEPDERLPFALRALLESAGRPEDYLHLLIEIYQAERDFRLLQVLPDTVLGRSPQQIYGYLVAVKSQVLYDLRNEAAADEIVARIKKLREEERTAIDLRALDLLEALVERQSAEVLNQKGPHVEACLAAIKRAFEREWADGEPRAMAGFLYALGKLPDPSLVDEQIRELRALRSAAPAASRDRLVITHELCKLLFDHYDRRPEAMQSLEAELTSYERAHDGKLPHEDNGVLDGFVSMLSQTGQHAAAELALQKRLERPVHEDQRRWLVDRLWHYYNVAFEHKGEVSLGKGEELFRNLVAFGQKQLDAAADENVLHEGVSKLTATFDIAHRLRVPGVKEPLETFAYETMPAVLKRQSSQYSNTAGRPVHVIHEALGPKAALRYVVERMEQWPQSLEISWSNGWNQLGSRLSDYRWELAEKNVSLGELEPRVLALVIAELKRELRSGESRSRQIYYMHYGHFWSEKTQDFAKAAEEVYRERKTSGRRLVYIAAYFRQGLEMRARSVEILLVAHREGILDRGGQGELVEWLNHDQRYGEAIALLEPLVKGRPDVMRYRVLLMYAYFHTKRADQLRDLVKQTDEHFHQQGRWIDTTIAEFAEGCRNCSLYKESVGYFDEAIAAGRRRNMNRSNEISQLSTWHQQLALAHSALGQTRQAVEAASGAVVTWPAHHDQRRYAVDSLRNVLAQAKDLNDYVKHLDDESAKTGQDSPLVRKMIGEVYQRRNEHERAISQFKIARELQPNDREVCQSLIECYDNLLRPAEATKELLAQLDFDRHDLKLYEQLVGRLKNDEAEAERAATSLVEAGPNEAENHQALAELRQRQDRWNEATTHWTEVAELRRLEPTGLLGLAAAQVHLKQWTAARQTLDKLQKTEWPARFNEALRKADDLRRQVPK